VTRKAAARSVLIIVVAVALGACTRSSSSGGVPAASPTTAPHAVLVAMGSAATIGAGLERPLSDSWPQKLFVTAFPRSTIFYNASDRGGVTVQRALGQQLALAKEVHATVVAIWLGTGDLEDERPPGVFEGNLDLLVQQLRDSGARVLIGNLSRSLPGAAAYDDAIARVARTRGATLVDLATALRAQPEIGPDSSVDVATSATIARAFAVALARP
jgi:lysophospholipase L1-like esterase